MAVEAVGDTVMEVDPIDAPQVKETDDTASETQADGAADQGDDDDGELVITIGDEQPEAAQQEEPGKAPEWVRDLRKSNRELVRKQRELEAENARLKGGGAAPQAVTLDPKPTLEGCDYDAEKFSADLEAWHVRRQQVEAQQRQAEQVQQQAQAAWNAKLEAYAKAKTALKVRDFEDAEGIAIDTFNTTQQGVILNGADNPAAVVYALGKNPTRAKTLAAINDPVKFAFAVAKLETQLKMTPKKTAPVPDKIVRGSAPIAGSSDKALDKLREEAARTGDLTKVNAYKRQMREKQRA